MSDEIRIVDNTIEEIKVEEFGGAPTGAMITTTHGYGLGEQHSIEDITGLKTKLDNIEKLKPVRSNIVGHADYYLWGEKATDNNPLGPGYFVRLSEDGKIYKCTNEITDVFGVTVSSAGFVGNDENIVDTYTSTKANNVNYDLVATTGVVDVLCYHDIVVGDYVFPTASGWAEKSTGSYGYLVTALVQNGNVVHEVNKQEVVYARIILSQSMVNEKQVSDNVDKLLVETKRLGENITTYGNTAEQALKRAEELTEAAQQSANTSSQNAQDATNAAVNAQNSAINAWNAAEQATPIAQKAAEDARVAQEAASALKNDAIMEANKVAAEVAQGNIELVKALEYRLDQYTVGQYSQAYGLTLAQAKAILPRGTIFIPMDEDPTTSGARQQYEEVYAGENEAGVTQIFTVGSAYMWDGEKWVVDKTVLITRTPTTQTEGDYWFVVKEYDGTEYNCGSLYRWENGSWKEVAIRKENVMNRTMAHLYHSDDTIRQSVSTVDNKVALVETKVTETNARVGLVASVPTELVGVKPANYNGNTEAIDVINNETDLITNWKEYAIGKGNGTYYYVVGQQLPYDVYICVVQNNNATFAKTNTITYDGVSFYKINVASIFTSANEDGSDIQLNANRINFNGKGIFQDKNGNITQIDGSYITTGTIDASKANITNLSASEIIGAINKSGDSSLKIKADHLIVDGSDISLAGKNINLTSDNIAIQSTNFNVDKLGNMTASNVDLSGTIYANSGVIGGCTITDGQLTVDKLSYISADLGTVTAGTIRSNNYLREDLIYIWPKEEIQDDVIDASEYLNITYDTYSNSYIVSYSSNKPSTDMPVKVIIPQTYDDGVHGVADVTAIYSGCLNWASLASVVLPNTITTIGNEAFAGCSSLTSVMLPDSVTSIGDGAFGDCTSLTSIIIPKSVTNISDYAFWNAFALTIYCETESKPDDWGECWNECNDSINCPVVWDYKNNDIADDGYIYTIIDGVRYALQDNTAKIVRQIRTITSVNIPNNIAYNGELYNITSITNSAFEDCDLLTSIIIPDNITSIGVDAFKNCTSLTIYCEAESKPSGWNNSWNSSNRPVIWRYMGEDVDTDGFMYTLINEGTEYSITAYSGTGSKVAIPASVGGIPVTTISAGVFNSKSFTSINIPNSITSIGNGAFAYCTSLTSVNIPTGITSISDNMFSNCTSLKSITIPDSVTSIGSSAFESCSSLTNVTLPNSVKSIGQFAFTECSSLINISIPRGVESIGGDAFKNCPLLTIYCGIEANPVSGWDIMWNSSDCHVIWGVTKFITDTQGVTYALSLDGTASVFSHDKHVRQLVIDTVEDEIQYPVTYINCAFRNYLGLIKLVVGSNVKQFAEKAFEGCTKLIEVYDERENTTLTKGTTTDGWVAYYAQNVYTPTNGESILICDGTCICYPRTKLIGLVNQISVQKHTVLSNNKIYNLDELRDTDIDYDVDTYQQSFLVIPDNITEIDDYAFYGNNDIESLIITQNVTTFSTNAFALAEDSYLKKIYCEGNQISVNTDTVDVYYLSQNEPGSTGNFWRWIEQKGIQISCENENMINSKGFKVSSNGTLTATNAIFSGTVNADSGKISGFELNESGLIGNKIALEQNTIKFGNATEPLGEISCNTNDNNQGLQIAYGKDQSTYIKFTNNGDMYDNCVFAIEAMTWDKDDHGYFYKYRVKIDQPRNFDTNVSVKFYSYYTRWGAYPDSTDYDAKITCNFTILARDTVSDWVTGDAMDEILGDTYFNGTTLYALYVRAVVNSVQMSESNWYRLACPNTDNDKMLTEPLTLAVSKPTPLLQSQGTLGQIECSTSFIPTQDCTKNSNGALSTDGCDLGGPNNRWRNLYIAGTAYSSSGTSVDISDQNLKNTINPISDPYTQIFDSLKPVTYKYNEGTNERLHTGFIAQDVKNAIEESGLTTKDFAGYCEWKDGDDNLTCGLRYSEFIALCVDQIQKLKTQVKELEDKLNTIQNN